MAKHRLKQLRDERKLTQQEIADIMEIPKSTYVHYERGSRETHIDFMIKAAKFYNVSLDYIFGIDDEREEKPLLNAPELLINKEIIQRKEEPNGSWMSLEMLEKELRKKGITGVSDKALKSMRQNIENIVDHHLDALRDVFCQQFDK